jgi:hypothetical protein
MTDGERLIRDAIKAFKAAIEAGDEADEAMTDWRTTAVQINKCLAELTAKPAAELAAETWG